MKIKAYGISKLWLDGDAIKWFLVWLCAASNYHRTSNYLLHRSIEFINVHIQHHCKLSRCQNENLFQYITMPLSLSGSDFDATTSCACSLPASKFTFIHYVQTTNTKCKTINSSAWYFHTHIPRYKCAKAFAVISFEIKRGSLGNMNRLLDLWRNFIRIWR